MCSKAALGAALLLERIARDTYSDRGPATVNPTQWAAMRYLKRAASESRTPNHLARYLGVTPGPASRMIASLERRRLVTRRPNPDDRRSILIDLTEHGLEILEEDPIERLAIAVDALTTSDRRALEGSLESIAGAISGGRKN